MDANLSLSYNCSDIDVSLCEYAPYQVIRKLFVYIHNSFAELLIYPFKLAISRLFKQSIKSIIFEIFTLLVFSKNALYLSGFGSPGPHVCPVSLSFCSSFKRISWISNIVDMVFLVSVGLVYHCFLGESWGFRVLERFQPLSSSQSS